MQRKIWIRNLAVVLSLWAGGTTLGFGFTAHVAPTSDAAPRAAVTEAVGGSRPVGRDLFFGILGRNLAVYAWLLCGLVSLGISTVVVTAFNGILLGQTLAIASAGGTSAGSIAWLILPHGLLEVSAFVVAAALGILGPRLARAWLSNEARLKAECRQLVRLWPIASVGAAALMVAAGIETYVTLPLAQSLEVGR